MKIVHRGWRYWMRLLFAAIVASLLAGVGTVLGVSYQHATGYLHPERQIASGNFLKAKGIEFREVELVTEDHIRLSAWYTPSQNGAVILVAHGYGANRPEEIYELFASHGYGVIAWDFRAHGTSGGDFSSLGYYETLDAKAALDFALAQPDVEQIGGWGGSMGAVTMIRATARYPEIEALVADSPYATLSDEMDIRIPFPMMRSLIQFFVEKQTGVSPDWVRPVDDIASISPRPVFLIQGMGDGMVPLDSAERLFDAAGEPRKLWTEPDVPHLSMYAYYRESYIERVISFFDEYLLK
jgi:uncharacterized protein